MKRNPSNNWNPGDTSTVDPPAVEAIGGGGGDRAPVELAVVDGGIDDGFLLPTLWELITDTSEEVPLCSPMTKLLDQLEENPRFRRGQLSVALGELKEVLEQFSHDSNGAEEVSLPVGTVTVLAHVLLRHQA